MTRSPSISVVIPAYNHESYILETLDSVFAQTFKDFEIIVVNDGSPDNTTEVLRPLVEAGRIRYFEQPNGGQASARNCGLREARGEFIAYLDDDDIWPEDKLAWQVAVLRADPQAVVVYGWGANIGVEDTGPGEGERFPDGLVYEEFCAGNHIRSPGQTLIRAVTLRALNGFDVTIKGADDWDLWIRLAKLGRFRYENKIALYCRNHSGNASRNVWAMYANCMRVVRKHFDPDSKRYRVAKRNVRRFIAHGFFDAGQWDVWSGHKVRAVKSFVIAGFFDFGMVLNRAKKVLTVQLSRSRSSVGRPAAGKRVDKQRATELH